MKSAVVRNPGQRRSRQEPKLSCELCRDRKVKCDKNEPCSNCTSLGVVCVPIQRLRLPRGRHVQRLPRVPPQQSPTIQVHDPTADTVDEGLVDRIRRLEALVGRMVPAPLTGSNAATRHNMPQAQGSKEKSPSTTFSERGEITPAAASEETKQHDFLAQQVDDTWMDLAKEIQSIRHAIDSTAVINNEGSGIALAGRLSDSRDSGMRVLGNRVSDYPSPIPQLIPLGRVGICRDESTTAKFCQTYLDQVDPIIKILHRPSLSKWMLQGGQYLEYLDGNPATEVLRAAVCYSAAVSMTESQCQKAFNASKLSVVADCRNTCEAALERSDLLSAKDITTLQGFVLYLSAKKAEDKLSKIVWTLMAVAVRIAKAICLPSYPDKETSPSDSFFSQQMRKRLWFTVSTLDIQTSFGQGSTPLTATEDVRSLLTLPANLDDSDFGPSTHPVPEKEDLTDTTFSLVTYHTHPNGRAVNAALRGPKDGGVGGSEDGGGPITSFSLSMSDVESRMALLRQFEQEVFKLLRFCDPTSSPYAWFTWHNSQCYIAATRLSALRPLHRVGIGGRTNPFRRREDVAELLNLTMIVLETARLMHTDPRGEGFRWCVTIPWHVLAIAFAECYDCADPELLCRAWPLVEASYRRHQEAISQNQDGAVQGPLGRLMHRARERLALLAQQGGVPSGDAPGEDGSKNAAAYPPSLNSAIPDFTFDVASKTVDNPFPALHSQQIWDPVPWSFNDQYAMAAEVPQVPQVPLAEHQRPITVSDQSWSAWDDFLADVSFNDIGDPDQFLFNINPEG